jgi:hypothetical protein
MNLHDIEVIEGTEDADEMEYFTSIQAAINSLEAWKFQGSMGRAMMSAIESGHCMLARSSTRDYWGNRIPSRDEVKAGTKGSADYVREHMGDDWAKTMEGVQ